MFSLFQIFYQRAKCFFCISLSTKTFKSEKKSEKDRKTERQKDRKTERQKDKKLSKTKRDIQRDRKTERHINRKRNRSKTSRNILYEVK